jgi:TP901 family phage tail tape measure protein
MSAREMRIRVLMSALDGASGPVKKLAQAASKTARVIKDQEKAVKALQKAQANVESFRKVRAEIGASAKAYRGARDQVARLRAEYAAIEKPTRRQTTALNAAVRASDKARQTYQLQAGRLKTLRNEFREAGGSARNLGVYEDQLKGKISRATREIEQQSAALDQLRERQQIAYAAQAKSGKLRERSGQFAVAGATTMAVAGAAALPYVAGAQQAMTFEDAIADLNKVANATPAQMKMLAAGFTELSETIPMSRAQLAAIGADLKRGGVPVAELKEATRQAAELGVALGMPAEEAGAMASKWRSAYKMTQREIQLTGDAVNEITNKFGGNVSDIAGIVTRSGALARAHGMNAGQVAAIGGAMNSAGVGEEVGATGLKNLLLTLGKGEAATKKQAEAFGTLGLEAVAMSKMLRDDAAGAVTLVMERIAKLPEHEQGSLLDQLFGSESIGALAPLLTDLDGLKERLALVKTEGQFAGSAARELVGELGKTSAQLQIVDNQKNNALGRLGETFLPELADIGGYLGDVASMLGKFAEANPALVKVSIVLLAIAGGIGALMLLIAAILAPMALLTTVAGALGLTLGAIMLPVLLVVAAVAALIAVGYLLWKNWDLIKGKGLEFVAWFQSLPAIFQSIGKAIVQGLVNGMMLMLNPLGHVVGLVSKLLPEGVKKTLGIHSPSRVFAKLGVHVMDGLALGLQQGEGRPLARIQGTAAALTAAAGVGFAGGFGFQATPAVARPAAAAASGDSYEVHFHPTPGMNERDLFRMFENWMANRDSRGRGSRLRAYTNDSDGD